MDAKRAYQHYTTVLEMVNSTKGSTIAFAMIGSNLFGAADCPEVKEWFYIVLNDNRGRKLVVAISYGNYDVWIRRVTSGTWSTDWLKLSSHVQPADAEWKALPMINEWTNIDSNPASSLKYRKGVGGKVVYVIGIIKQPNTLTSDNRAIAYLPEGYKLKNHFWSVTANETKGGTVTIRVSTDGKMYVTNYGSDVQTIIDSHIPVCMTIPL